MELLLRNWGLLLPLVLAAISVWLLMPARVAKPRIVGFLAGLGALLLLGDFVTPKGDSAPPAGLNEGLFFLFSAAALIAGTLMITSRNPVYGALWFAVTTLGVCGLYVLQSAPFLSAVTVIVYAGAIVVTFLFVIMLAQQEGLAAYDQTSRQPFAASVMACVLLGAILFTLQSWGGPQHGQTVPDSHALARDKDIHVLSRVRADENLGDMRFLGRSLFTDNLFAVELAGTLLLIATIGAIAMAPRRSQGTL